MTPLFHRLPAPSPSASRPPAAVEVTPEGVLAAALASSHDSVYAWTPLAAGVIAATLAETSLRSPDDVSAAIRTALDQVSPRSRSVTLILPDTLVRVFVLDFDAVPAKQDEAISVLRFRLRKMVPFDVEHAGLSYQILSRTEDEIRVLAAITPGPVLAEYEAAVRAAGYEPGVVLPSSLAALETMDSLESSLAALLTPRSLTTVITSGDDLLLYRTLDLPPDPMQSASEIQRGIAVASAYFEDRLRARPARLLYAGSGSRDDFASLLDDPELEIADLVPRPTSGLATALGEAPIAAVGGALAIHAKALRGGQAVAR